ncbi:unannotated protein [freshwater metagenome]|uniref:Unannotated protein n=1 Tax=freshwater metagenome TaxID=449393 RepID=A0A6J7CQB7_9ZZZZ
MERSLVVPFPVFSVSVAPVAQFVITVLVIASVPVPFTVTLVGYPYAGYRFAAGTSVSVPVPSFHLSRKVALPVVST